jgi:hypothetical protein
MRPRTKPLGDVLNAEPCGRTPHGELLYRKRCLWCKCEVVLPTRSRFCNRQCGSRATSYRRPVELFTPEVTAKRVTARRRAIEEQIKDLDPVAAYRKGYKCGYVAGYSSGKYGRYKEDRALLRGEFGDHWPKRGKAS